MNKEIYKVNGCNSIINVWTNKRSINYWEKKNAPLLLLGLNKYRNEYIGFANKSQGNFIGLEICSPLPFFLHGNFLACVFCHFPPSKRKIIVSVRKYLVKSVQTTKQIKHFLQIIQLKKRHKNLSTNRDMIMWNKNCIYCVIRRPFIP